MKLSTASAILCTALLSSFCNAFPYPDYWDDEAFLEQLQQEEHVGADVEEVDKVQIPGTCTFSCSSGSIFATNDSGKSIRRSPDQSIINYPCRSTPSIPIDGTIYDVILDCFTKCPDELSISNGVVEYHGIDNKLEPRDPDTTATYSCSGGYSLRGNSTRNCSREGEWLGEAPECVVPPTPTSKPGPPQSRCPELKLSDIPNNVPEAKRQLKNHRNYQQVIFKPYYNRRIEGDRFEGSKANLTCVNGWKLLEGTPAVQTCVLRENGKLVWTPPGTCVYYYSYRPRYG